MVPFGCFPSRSGDITRMMHAWDLLAKFYEMKVGGMLQQFKHYTTAVFKLCV